MVETKIHQRFLENLNVRNILDNGGFEIWQRGTGPWSVSGDITADRWMLRNVSASPASMLISKETTEVMKGTGALKCEITVAGGPVALVNLRQTVWMPELEGRFLSLSIWIKTTISNKVRLWIRDIGGDAFSDFHSGSGNWEKLTMTKLIVGDWLNVNFGIHEGDGANVTGIFYADNIMLVIGDEPMDFVPTLSVEDLMRCRRYYWRTDRFIIQSYAAVSLAKIIRWVPYSVPMKATPTWTLSGGTTTNFNNGGIVTANSNNIGFAIMLEAINSGAVTITIDDVNTGYIAAEIT